MSVNDLILSIKPTLQEHLVDKAEIFGSVARGEATEHSDIDLLVRMPSGSTLLQFVRLKKNLEAKLAKKVDLVEYDSISSQLAPYIFDKTVTVL